MSAYRFTNGRVADIVAISIDHRHSDTIYGHGECVIANGKLDLTEGEDCVSIKNDVAFLTRYEWAQNLKDIRDSLEDHEYAETCAWCEKEIV